MSKKSTILTVIILVIIFIFIILSKKPATSVPDMPDFNQLLISPTPQSNLMNDQNQNPQVESVTQLQIEDIIVGTGAVAKTGDTVVMNYLGTLQNGQKFDSSYDRNQPFEIQIGVGQVIKGWDEGVPGMKIGGKRKLIIPPDMAYGAQGAGDIIPPNATLIFEVELLDIK